MNPNSRTVAFHTSADSELALAIPAAGAGPAKSLVVEERGLGYRFTLHEHPYVDRLITRLLEGGSAGLQAVDTEYADGGVTVPGSVVVTVESEVTVSTADEEMLRLPVDTVVEDSNTGDMILPAGAVLRLARGGTPFVVPAGTDTTLAEGMAVTGSVFPLPVNGIGTLPPNSAMRPLQSVPAWVMPSGPGVYIYKNTALRTISDRPFTVPAGTPVRHQRCQWLSKELYQEIFTSTQYAPTGLVDHPHPVRDLDFSSGGAYAVYNWELFFHVPFTIAVHLSKNQRFAEAQRWFHYVFDPTDDTEGPTPERFWRFRPFQYTEATKIEQAFVNLVTGDDPALQEETVAAIDAWEDHPFRPHLVARYRQQAYMFKTVTAYLDNLIAWGDSLFRQDTGESIDEAMTHYVLAAEILGPRPQSVPGRGWVRPQTYRNLRASLKRFGTVLHDVETDLPFDRAPYPTAPGDPNGVAAVRSLGKALYFCVPRNDQLLAYWDTVADRLFKIRNSLNLAGAFRRLALFEPPIDPALLARATAAGVDVAAVVNGLNQPLPLVRFAVLVRKAGELAQEVTGLGAGLLSALEKEDGEALGILRARHERVLLELGEQVRYGQVQEAVKAREGLLRTLAQGVERYAFYERQLGDRRSAKEIAEQIPELDDLDLTALAKFALQTEEPELTGRQIEVDIATGVAADAAGYLYGGKLQSSHEARESILLEAGQLSADIANVLGVAAGIAHLFPDAHVDAHPWGVGGTVKHGGSHVGEAFNAGAGAFRAIADRVNFEARRAARIDSFARREREWAFQSNLAAAEIGQILTQLRGAQIREAIAEVELANHRKQIEQARTIEGFLNEDGTDPNGKRTGKALYTWMKREVRALHAQCFQLAFDVARKAERALQHELGDPSLNYLTTGYLAGNEGLLAGERLRLDVHRMELAYQDLDRREYELTRHVSLLQLDPLALVQLRATGRCTLRVPEAVFDLDTPGHYFRRIRGAAVSVPCVTGPYTGVNLTLTLMKSSIRTTPVVGDSYTRTDTEDPRFDDYFGSAQSVVTSTGQNDSGLFDAGMRDERYLPFEYAGAISEWQLELPADPSAGDPSTFDYETISDIVLHLRYTARAGGDLLRQKALESVHGLIGDGGMAGQTRLFSIRHEFPTEWAALRAQPGGNAPRAELALTLRPEHYPFFSQSRLDGAQVDRVDVLARSAKDTPPPTLRLSDQPHDTETSYTDDLLLDATRGNLLAGRLTTIPLPPAPTGDLALYLEDTDLSDLWIAVTWSAGRSGGGYTNVADLVQSTP